MSIQIENNIPAPSKPSSRNSYPFGELEVGQSFVVELDGLKSWATVFTAIQNAQNRYGIKLTTRLIEEGRRRIWRVA